MKQRIRKCEKVWLALFLTLAIIAQSFTSISFGTKAASTGYTELNFSHWGTSEGKVGDVNAYSLTNPDIITDLDGVAISGTINLNGLSWGNSFVTFGGTETSKGSGFQLVSTGGSWTMRSYGIGSNTGWITLSCTKLNVDVNLRITFDKADDETTWTVGVYADGTSVGTITYSGVTPGTYIGFAPNVTADMTGGYKEMRFGDWGTSEGASGGVNVYSLTNKTAISSLDGVAVSGTINFNGQSWANSFITFGGTSTTKHGGFQLVSTGGTWMIRTSGINSSTAWTTLSCTKVNTDVLLRVTFDHIDGQNTWLVNIYADGTSVGVVKYSGATPGLYFGFAPNVTVDMTTEYKEMTFADWGTDAGTSDVYDIYSLTDTTAITSLAGVAITGKVNYNGDTGTILRIGGTESLKHAGFSLMTQPNTGRLILWAQGLGNDSANNVVMEAADWAELIDTEFTLRLAFKEDVATSVWSIEVSINGELVKTLTYASVTPGLYIANNGVTVEGLAKEEPQPYKEMTFADWGTDAGTSDVYDIYSLTDTTAITSLAGVAITGKVNYNGDTGAILRIGGKESLKHAGFSLMTQPNTGRLILWAQGLGNDSANNVVMEAADWAELIDTEFTLRLAFKEDVATSVWSIEVSINGELVKTLTYASVTPGLYIANKGVIVEGMAEGTPHIFVDMTDDRTGYLIEAVDGIIDSVAVYEGNYYKIPGEHVFEYTEDGTKIIQKLILYIQGDANMDSTISAADLVRIKRYNTWPDSFTLNMADIKALDFNNDEVVTETDEGLLLQYVVDYEEPASERKIHYGLGEPVHDTGRGEVEYASGDFVASILGAYGVDSYRLWMSCIGTAMPDGNGGYTVTLNQAQLAKLKSLVARLRLNGVEQIVAMQNPLIPYDFPKYVGKDGNTYSAQDMANGLVSDATAVRMDSYAFPAPGTEEYDTFMKVQEEYFRLLSEAVPGITHYEGMNEPDAAVPHTVHKIGWLSDSERANLTDASSYPESETFEYSIEEIAQITVDHCHAMTNGIRAAKSEAKVLSAGLTLLSTSCDYLVATYDYIESSDNYYKDQTPDNYFEILNWHPYVFVNNNGNPELAGNVRVNNGNWGKDYWGEKWIAYQKKLYAVAEAHGDGDSPVWFTEMGQSDYGSYDVTNPTNYGGDITSALAAQRIEDMFSLIESDLPFVDTVIAFRVFDKGDSTTDGSLAGEGGYGMIEEFDKVSSGTEALKDYGKAYYNIVKGDNASYGALTRVLDKYYDIYKGVYELDQSEDFQSAVVRDNTFVTNHSDISVTFSGGADYMMQPTMAMIELEDSQALAFDYQETTSTIANPVSHISFNFGKLEAGTYKFTFDLDGMGLDDTGYWGSTYFGITTNTVPHNWTSGAIANDVEDTGIVNYRFGQTNTFTANGLTFTVTEAQEHVAAVFQVSGNASNNISHGTFRVIFDNISLEKVSD